MQGIEPAFEGTPDDQVPSARAIKGGHHVTSRGSIWIDERKAR
jgi:hypothetical protein